MDANWADPMLAGAAQSLQGMQQQQLNLRQAVDSGQLKADPAAAAAAAKACRTLSDKLDGHIYHLGQRADQSGYGKCTEGDALQGKMQGKFQHAIALLQ